MKLLAALDLSRTTPDVLREARNWARRLSAELFLIHVAEPDPDFIGYGAGPESVRLAVAHKFQRAHQQIEALAVELRQDGLNATALLVQGPTAETILREADKLSVDAIIMGTRARSAFANCLWAASARRFSTNPPALSCLFLLSTVRPDHPMAALDPADSFPWHPAIEPGRPGAAKPPHDPAPFPHHPGCRPRRLPCRLPRGGPRPAGHFDRFRSRPWRNLPPSRLHSVQISPARSRTACRSP